MSSVNVIFAILASAVIVVGGLVALVRSILNVAIKLRDNTHAVGELTRKMTDLALQMDGRLDGIENRLSRLEGP